MELSYDTKWIICMWDIRGEPIKETAMCLKLTIDKVVETISECKSDGFYDKVRRHIEQFDIENAQKAMKGFASMLVNRDNEVGSIRVVDNGIAKGMN